MKKFNKVMALVLSVAVVLAMSVPMMAFAGTDTAHTITITTNGDGAHTYGAYQIFVGNLDASGQKLSNVEWGSAITDDGAALINAIKADNTLKALFTDEELSGSLTAAKIADKLGGKENDGAVAKAFADAVNTALGNATTTTSGTTTDKTATINVTGDGYYFIKDTGSIVDKDTATRFMLQVVGNVTVNAKDTKITPDKEIVKEDGTDVTPTKDNDASIGDVITYQVTIPVPDTTQYKKDFVFIMNDTLSKGLTFKQLVSVKIDGKDVPTGNYEMTPANASEGADLVHKTEDTTTDLKLMFKDFKQYVEADSDTDTEGVQNLIGKNVVITYEAVVNEKATLGAVANTNTVHFDYSNNPNYTYDGDDFPEGTPEDVKGKTPNDTTKTFVTSLELLKTGEGDDASKLAGAEFQLTGTSRNNVLVSGEKFESSDYVAKDGETIVANEVYYKLKDGSYTTTAKSEATAAQYEEGTATYVKVTYSKVVKEAKNVDLTLISGEDGKISVEGIEQGTYTIKETKAPSGYNLDETEYTLVIGWTNPDAKNASDAIKASGGFSKDSGSSEQFTMSSDGGKFAITITNKSGTTLPSTGGIGTTIFYVLGAILVIGAGVLLVTRRRMNAN